MHVPVEAAALMKNRNVKFASAWDLKPLEMPSMSGQQRSHKPSMHMGAAGAVLSEGPGGRIPKHMRGIRIRQDVPHAAAAHAHLTRMLANQAQRLRWGIQLTRVAKPNGCIRGFDVHWLIIAWGV